MMKDTFKYAERSFHVEPLFVLYCHLENFRLPQVSGAETETS